MPLTGGMIGDQPNSSGMTSMTDDNVIRVPRVTRTGPFSALSVWPPDAAGIATTTFHTLARPHAPPRPPSRKEISQVPG
jgi:hypothetical protein